jgi:hypothetical protein
MIKLTIDDIRLAFIQIIQGATFGHKALTSPAVNITNKRVFDGLMIITQESLVQGIFKGLITFKANSHNSLDNGEVLGQFGAVMDDLIRDLMLTYSEKICELGAGMSPEQMEQSAASSMNKATAYTFKEHDVKVQVALDRANKILERMS